MIIYYFLAGAVALLLTAFARSHRVMNSVSVVHAASVFGLTAYSAIAGGLPAFYTEERYFFIDNLASFEVMLSSIVFFLAAVYSSGYVESLVKVKELDRKYVKAFYTAFNALLSATVLAFFSNNMALLWIFVELTTLFSAFLIAILNSRENIDAALKYILLTSTAMLFSFAGLILMFMLSQGSLGEGSLNWDVLVAGASSFPAQLAALSFAFMFIGFAAKAGIVPCHLWLPDADARSPSAVSAILSAAVSNIGIYCILRAYAIAGQTGAAGLISRMMMAFGVLSVAVAVFSMLRQDSLKRLISFSSIENGGFGLAGTAIGTPVAVFWVLFYIAAQSLCKALMFFSAGILHMQYESTRAHKMINALALQPAASWGLVIGAAALAGMPPFAMFLPKLFVLSELASASGALLLVMAGLLLIGASALALFLVRTMTRTAGESVVSVAVPAGLKLPLFMLTIMIVLAGLFVPEAVSDFLMNAAAAIARGERRGHAERNRKYHIRLRRREAVGENRGKRGRGADSAAREQGFRGAHAHVGKERLCADVAFLRSDERKGIPAYICV